MQRKRQFDAVRPDGLLDLRDGLAEDRYGFTVLALRDQDTGQETIDLADGERVVASKDGPRLLELFKGEFRTAIELTSAVKHFRHRTFTGPDAHSPQRAGLGGGEGLGLLEETLGGGQIAALLSFGSLGVDLVPVTGQPEPLTEPDDGGGGQKGDD